MSIQKLSNQEVGLNLKNLVVQERELLHSILLHIQQIEARRIYFDRAYASTFEYLVKELSYSGSAAMRRLEIARLLKEIPSMAIQIESGDLNLTQIGDLSRALKEKAKQSGERVSLCQRQEILQKIAGKSVPETQKEISRALDLEIQEPERTQFQKDSVSLSIQLTQTQYEKLCRCKDPSAYGLAQKNQDFTLASVIEHLADQFLVKNHTAEKAPAVAIAAAESKRVNKSITPKTRKMILSRDKHCQYVDRNSGRQCQSTFGLEVDHLQPRFAVGEVFQGSVI
ncbi:MAG: hypothetical protein ACK5P7_07185 [Bdellovibrio sp.]|jgi:hypothetical protein